MKKTRSLTLWRFLSRCHAVVAPVYYSAALVLMIASLL